MLVSIRDILAPLTFNGTRLKAIARNEDLTRFGLFISWQAAIVHGLFLAITRQGLGAQGLPFQDLDLSYAENTIILVVMGFGFQLIMPVFTALMVGFLLNWQGRVSNNYETYRIFTFSQIWLIIGYIVALLSDWFIIIFFYLFLIISFAIGYARNIKIGYKRTLVNLPFGFVLTYFAMAFAATLIGVIVYGMILVFRAALTL